MPRGKLICLESQDGGGKSTQVEIIKEYLNKKNTSFVSFHFPMYGHNKFSDIISMYLRGDLGNISDVDPLFIANIYAMDRFKFLPELNKALQDNDVVLLDRYVYSNIAYQGAKHNDELKSKEIKEWIFNFEFNFLQLPYPDLNIFFDLPIEVIRKRLQTQRVGNDRDYLLGKQDIHEADIDFQERVRNSYISSMEGAVNCKIISCTFSVGEGFGIHMPFTLFETYKKYLDHVVYNEYEQKYINKFK